MNIELNYKTIKRKLGLPPFFLSCKVAGYEKNCSESCSDAKKRKIFLVLCTIA